MKLLKFLLVVAFLFGSYAFAQSAQVIQVTEAERAEAQAKYETLRKAQIEWDNFKARIQNHYLPACSGNIYYFNGYQQQNAQSICNSSWGGNGIEFTTDFKFIVPKTDSTKQTTPWSSSNLFIGTN